MGQPLNIRVNHESRSNPPALSLKKIERAGLTRTGSDQSGPGPASGIGSASADAPRAESPPAVPHRVTIGVGPASSVGRHSLDGWPQGPRLTRARNHDPALAARWQTRLRRSLRRQAHAGSRFKLSWAQAASRSQLCEPVSTMTTSDEAAASAHCRGWHRGGPGRGIRRRVATGDVLAWARGWPARNCNASGIRGVADRGSSTVRIRVIRAG